MFLLSSVDELTSTKICQIIQTFMTTDRVTLDKYHKYYKGDQEIMRKYEEDKTKPCNRVVTNYCYNIVNNYQGYITGIDVTYTMPEEAEAIQDILNYNDVQAEDNEFLKSALVYGVAYEINYIDEDGQQRFKVLDSRECIPIFDNTLNQELLAVIRFYLVDPLDMSKGYYVDVYDNSWVYNYKMTSGFSSLQFMGGNRHYYNQVPVTVFYLNKEHESIFDKIMTLQDAYNKLLSKEIDDFEAFCDAYLVLSGGQFDEAMVSMFKSSRVIGLPPGGEASFLNKSISDTQIENMLDNINKQIHKISNSPDFTDDAFGTSSGIAMKYKLLGFENVASSIVTSMTKSLQRRLELICAILNMTGEDAMWRDVEIVFTRNLPADLAEVANMVNSLRGLVSDKTLLSQIPFVSNIQQELEQIEGESASKASQYNLTLDNDVLD